jgi:hypothetical protein
VKAIAPHRSPVQQAKTFGPRPIRTSYTPLRTGLMCDGNHLVIFLVMVSLSKNEFGFQFCAGQAARIGGVHDVYPVSFGFDVSGKFDLLVYGAEASFVFGDMFGKKTISTKNKGHTGLSILFMAALHSWPRSSL